MKNLYKIFRLMILIFAYSPFLYSQSQIGPSIDTIIIDPGHGGSDPGAINQDDKTLMEKDINLEISKNLVLLIKEKLPNIKIVHTRNGDFFVSLGERSKIANQFANKKSLFISIHTNSHSQVKRKIEGVEVFYHYSSNSTIANFRIGEYMHRGVKDENPNIKNALGTIINSKAKEDSKLLAKHISQGIHIASKEPIRQVSPSSLYVVSYSILPAILVEVGFINNDKLKNKKYLNRLSKGIFLGILGYMKEQEKV